MSEHHDIKTSLGDMKQAVLDMGPVLSRFFSALWNCLMKGLIAIKAMPFIVKMPWILPVLIVVLILICPYLALILLPMGLIAYSRGVTAADNFLIPIINAADSKLDDIDQTPL